MHESDAEAPPVAPTPAAAPRPLPPAASDRVGPPDTPAVFAPPADTWRRISPAHATVRRLRMSITLAVTALGAGAVVWLETTTLWMAAIPLVALAPVWLWLWVRARRVVAAHGYAERDADLCITKGLWFKQLIIVPFGRMQVVKVTSGPLMRAFGLATVQLVTASAQTDAVIPGLPLEEARVLRDRLIELSDAKGSGL